MHVYAGSIDVAAVAEKRALQRDEVVFAGLGGLQDMFGDALHGLAEHVSEDFSAVPTGDIACRLAPVCRGCQSAARIAWRLLGAGSGCDGDNLALRPGGADDAHQGALIRYLVGVYRSALRWLADDGGCLVSKPQSVGDGT
jgi:hypothetical protein